MKKYIVFKWFSIGSPILKFSTYELEDARMMRNLLTKEDTDSLYIICEVIE